MKINEIKKMFLKDLFLAKSFLILEAIETSTLENIKIIGIKLAQGIGNSDAVKNSKLLKLNDAVKTANSFIASAFNIKDNQDMVVFRERASKLIAGIEFLYMIQDLTTTLAKENIKILQKFEEYKQNDSNEIISQINNNQNNKQQLEKIEDPTIEILLQTNESKALILRLMQLFTKRSPLSKDPQSAKFFTVTKNIKNKSYTIIPPANYRIIATDITKLTFTQFQNIIKILQMLAIMITRIRAAMASATPAEIRKKLLGEPVND